MNAIVMPETLLATAAPAEVAANSGREAIRPFRVDIPEEALVDLRNRLAATRLPEQETVSDNSQGVRLARRSRSSSAIGRPNTTGARSRRN